MTGQKFGRLTVIEIFKKRYTDENRNYTFCRCFCTCGKEKTVRKSDLISGRCRSCGCLSIDKPSHRTHGLSKTPLYIVWGGIIQRCYNKNHTGYHNYGGRGIRVCKKWHRFENFCQDILTCIGKRPSKQHSLDRIDNNRGYEPRNIRWATAKEQCRNKRTNRIFIVSGQKMILKDIAHMLGIHLTTLRFRLERIKTIDETIAYYKNKQNHLQY